MKSEKNNYFKDHDWTSYSRYSNRMPGITRAQGPQLGEKSMFEMGQRRGWKHMVAGDVSFFLYRKSKPVPGLLPLPWLIRPWPSIRKTNRCKEMFYIRSTTIYDLAAAATVLEKHETDVRLRINWWQALQKKERFALQCSLWLVL